MISYLSMSRKVPLSLKVKGYKVCMPNEDSVTVHAKQAYALNLLSSVYILPFCLFFYRILICVSMGLFECFYF